MTLAPKLRVGLRREILILFPVAILLLVVLSSFVIVSYRTAVDLFTSQRQEEAADFAARAVTDLPADRRPTSRDLRGVSRGSRRAAIARPSGKPVVVVGEFDRPILAPLEGRTIDLPIGTGPSEVLPREIAGFATFRRHGQSYVLRLDLPADELAIQAEALDVLTWVVVGVSAGIAVLVLFFLRHLLRPYEALLAQAHRIGEPDEAEDEITFLTKTIEQALGHLADPPTDGDPATDDSDILALQRALGPSLESGFMLIDREAEVISINAFGAAVLGAEDREDLQEVRRLLADAAELHALLRHAVAVGGNVQRREVVLTTGAGRRTLGVTVHPLRRDDGEARAYLTLFVDLTEARRREREEKVTENLTQLGEMAAGVAHELRNSLATVRGYLTLIERKPEEESLADYLQEMRRESDHLQRVVDDFLAFARPETTRLEDVDLSELAQRTVTDPALEAGAARFSPPDAPVPSVRGDAQLLERALRNLVHNAAQAQQARGVDEPVEITLEAADGDIELRVEDAGGGLPSEVRDRLFQPFVTGRADGVGLGLSLAHRIVSLHGGRLSLDDVEGGTRATIRFAAPAPAEAGGTIE